ncbi:MAG: glycoside hydrolase family 15 protein [Chloroflexi bacterium]|nr:glycoside hydrolase family 15 protein [Chloroflexota bacterium]
MPRSLSIGNGSLQINFDLNYKLRDIFFPWVGAENHSAGDGCLTGIWVDGRLFWIDDPIWAKEIRYARESLVTEVTAENKDASLKVIFHDAVDFFRNIFLRQVTITNLADTPREIRVFFHYDFHIYGVKVGDTVYYEPERKALLAFKGKRYFMINSQVGGRIGLDSWATGISELHGREGTWRDAEDGILGRNPIAQGSVDATVAANMGVLPPGGSATVYHWLDVGRSAEEVKELDGLVRTRGPQSFITRTLDYWRAWVNKEEIEFADLPQPVIDFYKTSLLILRSQIDNQGAIIASTDWDIASWARDTYAYMWPRDGAMVALALDKAGHSELSRNFFDFCTRVITHEGYFLQKYVASGEAASSWHPWVDAREQKQLPIQEDETALPIYALWKYYQKCRDIEFLRRQYRPLVKNAADFMVDYREPNTLLPVPSYDLWEERRAIHAFTVASVWAGLQAAANITDLFNEKALSERYRKAAGEIREATIRYMFDKKANRFLRSIYVDEEGVMKPDNIIDSSLLWFSLFGMFHESDPMLESTVRAVRERLWCQTAVGGLARYEGDSYHKVSTDAGKVAGNPWFICTLWLAQYYIARTTHLDDLEAGREFLTWVVKRALPSGVLAEQINPYTREPLSVSPLTWSHAEFVSTVHNYLAKYRQLMSA